MIQEAGPQTDSSHRRMYVTPAAGPLRKGQKFRISPGKLRHNCHRQMKGLSLFRWSLFRPGKDLQREQFYLAYSIRDQEFAPQGISTPQDDELKIQRRTSWCKISKIVKKYQIYEGLNKFMKMSINISLTPFIFTIQPFSLFLQIRSVDHLQIYSLKLSLNKHNNTLSNFS